MTQALVAGRWPHSCASPRGPGVPSHRQRCGEAPAARQEAEAEPCTPLTARVASAAERAPVPETAEVGVATHFPFLIVFLPRRGSSTGSTVSPMFSMSKVSPSEMACSMMSR